MQQLSDMAPCLKSPQGHLFSFVDLQVTTRDDDVVHTHLDMLGTWQHSGAITDIKVRRSCKLLGELTSPSI